MIPSPVYRTDPEEKKGEGGVSRTSLLIVQQRWVVSELITLAPKTLIGLKLCQSRQHAWGSMQAAKWVVLYGPRKRKKERHYWSQQWWWSQGWLDKGRKNTDFGDGGGAATAFGGGPDKEKKTLLSKMRDRETWQDACGALGGGLRQRKDTLLSKMRDTRETWQDAGSSALGGPRQRKEKKKTHCSLRWEILEKRDKMLILSWHMENSREEATKTKKKVVMKANNPVQEHADRICKFRDPCYILLLSSIITFWKTGFISILQQKKTKFAFVI